MIEPLVVLKFIAIFYIGVAILAKISRKLSFFLISQEVYEVNDVWEWREYIESKAYEDNPVQNGSSVIKLAVNLKQFEMSCFIFLAKATPILAFVFAGYMVYLATVNA